MSGAPMTRRYAHLSPPFRKGAAAKLDTAFAGLFPEPDGTQMKTNGEETVSTRVHSYPSDENIQANKNSELTEITHENQTVRKMPELPSFGDDKN